MTSLGEERVARELRAQRVRSLEHENAALKATLVELRAAARRACYATIAFGFPPGTGMPDLAGPEIERLRVLLEKKP